MFRGPPSSGRQLRSSSPESRRAGAWARGRSQYRWACGARVAGRGHVQHTHPLLFSQGTCLLLTPFKGEKMGVGDRKKGKTQQQKLYIKRHPQLS